MKAPTKHPEVEYCWQGSEIQFFHITCQQKLVRRTDGYLVHEQGDSRCMGAFSRDQVFPPEGLPPRDE